MNTISRMAVVGTILCSITIVAAQGATPPTSIHFDIWRHLEACKHKLYESIDIKMSLGNEYIYYKERVVLKPEGDQQLMTDLSRPTQADAVSLTHLSNKGCSRCQLSPPRKHDSTRGN